LARGSRVSFEGDDAIVIDMGADLRVLGTTVTGGSGAARRAVMGRIREYVRDGDFEDYARGLARRIGVPDNSPVFLTAADLRASYVSSRCRVGRTTAEVHATFGLSLPGMACLGDGGGNGRGHTINVLAVLNAHLSPAGMLDAFRALSEVKGALSALSGFSCEGSAAVGTVSDATLVAAPGGRLRYSGLATAAGRAIACALTSAYGELSRRLGPRGRLRIAMSALDDPDCDDGGVEAVARALRCMDMMESAGLLRATPSDVPRRLLEELGSHGGAANFTELANRVIGSCGRGSADDLDSDGGRKGEQAGVGREAPDPRVRPADDRRRARGRRRDRGTDPVHEPGGAGHGGSLLRNRAVREGFRRLRRRPGDGDCRGGDTRARPPGRHALP